MPAASTRSLSLSAVVLATSLAHSQDEYSRGPFAFDPVAVSRPRSNAPSSIDRIFIKASGDQNVTPAPYTSAPSSSMIPDFRASAIFHSSYESVIDIDALSTGNDWLPVNEDGVVDPSMFNAWHSLLFTVTDSAQGLTGSILQARQTSGKNVGGDIYNYFFPGSIGVEPELIDTVVLAQATTQIGLGDAPDEIDAIDFHLPKIVADQFGSDPFIGMRTRLYFSLTEASAAVIRSQTLLKPFVGLSNSQVTGRHIYYVEWSTQNQSWSTTAAVFDLSTALVDPIASSDDVDAIAIDTRATGEPTILFSTTNLSRPQIEVAVWGYSPPNYSVHPVTTTSTDPITRRIQISSSDNINGLAGIDPHGYSLGKSFCTPLPQTSEFPRIHLSTSVVTSTVNPEAKTELGVLLSGWSDTLPGTGDVFLHFDLLPMAVSFTLGPYSRTAADHSMQWAFPINYPVLIGEYFFLRAEYIPSGGSTRTSYVASFIF